MVFDKNNLKNLAEKYGTPLYVYEGDLILQRYHELYNFIPWKKLQIYYAMKANYNIAILKLLEKEGANIDAVSPGDILMAMEAGFTKERILFTANKITNEEMHEVQKLGVLFNIGSISRLEKYGQSYPGSEVCIRFNPDVVAGENKNVATGGENSKFGIFLEKVDDVVNICNHHNLKVVGIHEHTGSGIPETVQMMQGMKNILNLITPKRFPDLRFVDFGGGFKVPYHPDEKRLDYHLFGKEVVTIFSEFCQSYGKELEMYFEPGKYLVAESGNLIVEVTEIKQNPGKVIIGTNSGFPQLIRPMFYGAYHHIINLSNPEGPLKEYDIVGNICESGDCFAVDRELPEIREGDFLVIQNAGAYCYSMGGVYNLRAMPAEVLMVDGKDQLVRKRLSNQELIKSIVDESC
ncbi:diaminopimelate decarboxylase [Candidatus Woesearchaeota archaeon]|nr:diaminopimelate decarboxylase [Candidatus Woesearchaeota archaeon]